MAELAELIAEEEMAAVAFAIWPGAHVTVYKFLRR